MAKKRAQVDLCLTALAASDCFAQDLEDEHTLGERPQPPQHPKGGTRAPERATAPQNEPEPAPGPTANGNVTEAQLRVLRAKLDDAGLPEKSLCSNFGIEVLGDMPASQINAALDIIRQQTS